MHDWNRPEGYGERPPAVLYLICDRGVGDRVERLTEQAMDPVTHRWHRALSCRDQAFADELAALAQRAGEYFLPDDAARGRVYRPLEGVADVALSDDEVRERVRRLTYGENKREADRVAQNLPYAASGRHKHLFLSLDELPWTQQRALAEQLVACARRWGFEAVREATAEDVVRLTGRLGTADGYPDYLYEDYLP